MPHTSQVPVSEENNPPQKWPFWGEYILRGILSLFWPFWPFFGPFAVTAKNAPFVDETTIPNNIMFLLFVWKTVAAECGSCSNCTKTASNGLSITVTKNATAWENALFVQKTLTVQVNFNVFFVFFDTFHFVKLFLDLLCFCGTFLFIKLWPKINLRPLSFVIICAKRSYFGNSEY